MDQSVRSVIAPTAITARIITVEQFLTLGRFQPASVQRSFRWEPTHALQLLNDLETMFRETDEEDVEADADPRDETDTDADAEADAEAMLDPDAPQPAAPAAEAEAPAPLSTFFLGTIVLLGATADRDADGPLELYDGLQRTTTLTILFAILRDLDPDPGAAAVFDRLISDADSFRLGFPERDATLERDVQRPGATVRMRGRTTAQREVGKSIQRVKNALLDRIDGWEDARRRRFGRFVAERAVLAVADVADPRLARQIFVSTNLYGKPLEPIETLKGQLIDCAAAEADEATVLALWTETTQAVGADVYRFLAAVDMLERCQTQMPQWPTDLGDHVRRRYGPNGVVRWMERLRRSADAWSGLRRTLREAGSNAVEREVWRLHVLPFDDWQPLALQFWSRYQRARDVARDRGDDAKRGRNRERGYRRLFQRLHRRSMALALADLSTPTRRMIFAKAAGTAQTGRDPTRQGRDTLFPTVRQRRKIDRTLRSQIKEERVWGALVRWLEIAEWRDGLPGLMRAATVEHVLPRNPRPHSDSAAVAQDSAEYDRLCYSLGNLALLNGEINARITNLDYTRKRAILTDEAADYTTLRSVVVEPTWGADEIERRAEMLRLETWRLLDLQPPT